MDDMVDVPIGGSLERIRTWVRGKLGFRHPVYRLASAVTAWSRLAAAEGFANAWKLWNLRTGYPTQVRTLQLRSLPHPLHVRPGTADIGAVLDNLVRHEYGQLRLQQDAPLTVVDAGAYIGDTALYFLTAYPNSSVIALEPDAANYRLLQQNLAPYEARAVLLKRALFNVETKLGLSGRETGVHFVEDGPGEVESITMREILRMIPSGRIDVLKLDIEGAELRLFSSGAKEWLPFVRFIIVETHGQLSERTTLGALASEGWHVERYRNLYYCAAPAS